MWLSRGLWTLPLAITLSAGWGLIRAHIYSLWWNKTGDQWRGRRSGPNIRLDTEQSRRNDSRTVSWQVKYQSGGGCKNVSKTLENHDLPRTGCWTEHDAALKICEKINWRCGGTFSFTMMEPSQSPDLKPVQHLWGMCQMEFYPKRWNRVSPATQSSGMFF